MTITIVVPCYNEQEVLPWSIAQLLSLTDRLRHDTGDEARLMFVDDGSTDSTWDIIAQAAAKHDGISGLKLAHNVGHQNALWAGIEQTYRECDATVSIDADLQDDSLAIIDMARHYGWLLIRHAAKADIDGGSK